jgi:hypothetical protein
MISVHEAEKLSLLEIEPFLLAAKGVRFEASQREEIYGWVERLLCQQGVRPAGTPSAGLGTALPGEDDGAEPRATYALGGPLPGNGASRDPSPPTPSFPRETCEFISTRDLQGSPYLLPSVLEEQSTKFVWPSRELLWSLLTSIASERPLTLWCLSWKWRKRSSG